MEVKDMTVEQLEARKAELAKLLDAEDADLDAIEAEVRHKGKSVTSRYRCRVEGVYKTMMDNSEFLYEKYDIDSESINKKDRTISLKLKFKN